jgi:hypothetical protein
MKQYGAGCGKIRQEDEFYCPICHTRWAINDIKPPCVPLEMPVQVFAKNMSKSRYEKRRARARKYGR